MHPLKTAALVLTVVLLVFELILAIPFIGGSIVVFSGYTALVVTGALYLGNIVVRAMSKTNFVIPVFGLIFSFAAVVPFLGWALHLLMVILLIIDLILLTIHKKED